MNIFCWSQEYSFIKVLPEPLFIAQVKVWNLQLEPVNMGIYHIYTWILWFFFFLPNQLTSSKKWEFITYFWIDPFYTYKKPKFIIYFDLKVQK